MDCRLGSWLRTELRYEGVAVQSVSRNFLPARVPEIEPDKNDKVATNGQIETA
jgi:hypothetical protein